jgi:hypothetical protein
MKLYFSGIAGPSEYRMLERAGVRHLLADPFDLKHIPAGRPHVALDSGAYRAFKGGLSLDLERYLTFVRSHGPFDFAVSLDEIGAPRASRENWERLRRLRSNDDPPLVPVFQWGGERDDLKRYLDEADLVGIGGLVDPMRNKNERMLDQLGELCSIYPKRFHVFGCNWLRAISELRGLIASADTSKWLDGGRYAHLIFVNTRTGKLSQAPAKALKLDLNREDRCVQSARNLEDYISSDRPSTKVSPPESPPAAGKRAGRSDKRRRATIKESKLREVNRKLRRVGAKAFRLPEGFAQYDNRIYLGVELHDHSLIACKAAEVFGIALDIEPDHNWEDVQAWWPNRPVGADALAEAGTKKS